jgi:hypothetical protein
MAPLIEGIKFDALLPDKAFESNRSGSVPAFLVKPRAWRLALSTRPNPRTRMNESRSWIWNHWRSSQIGLLLFVLAVTNMHLDVVIKQSSTIVSISAISRSWHRPWIDND